MPPSAPHPQTPTAPQQQVPQRDVAILDGVLERVTFSNPETGYTIARIAPDRGTGRNPVSASTELITAVGPLLGAQIGESLRLRGRWTSHMKYGRQFDVRSYTTVLPVTEQGIRRYCPGVTRAVPEPDHQPRTVTMTAAPKCSTIPPGRTRALLNYPENASSRCSSKSVPYMGFVVRKCTPPSRGPE